MYEADPAEIYDRYLGPAMFEPWAEVLVSRAQLSPGMRTLDVACGTGIVSRALARAGAWVTGVDLGAHMIARARRRTAEEALDVAFEVGDGTRLAQPSSSFERVLCQQGLQFFSDRAGGAREMRRVLEPGGLAVVACWCAIDESPHYEALHRVVERSFGASGFARPFSIGGASELEAVLGAGGFAEVAIEKLRRPVRYPRAREFVRLSLLAAAAVMPDSFEGAAERERAVEEATAEAARALSPWVEGDVLVSSMASWVATARA
jgi:SAM-dependent methyltransferase